MEAGRGEAGGDGEPEGNLPSFHTDHGCLAHTWSPTLVPQAVGVSQALGFQESRRSTPIDLGARKPGRGPMSKVLE